MSSTDVVVIGAGVIGCAIALDLARRGYDVVVVDRAGAPGQGSTSASSAVVRFNYSMPDGVATAWEAMHYWSDWDGYVQLPAMTQLARLHRTGAVLLDAPNLDKNRTTALFDQIGVPYEYWDSATLRQRVPAIDAGRHWPPKAIHDTAFYEPALGELGALYTPDAGFIDDPQLATLNLADAAARAGVRFAVHRPVTGVDIRNGRVVGIEVAHGQRIAAPVVVNAAGPWSREVNRLAAVGDEFTVRVRPMRQEVHEVAAPAGYGTNGHPGPVIADLDLGTYIRPSSGGKLLIGSTEPECDALEWLDDADGYDPRPTADRFEAQVLRAARRLPALRIPNRPKGIVGVYDVSDDWLPIYDCTDLAGFYVAMGTSGNQFKNAPLAGRFLGALIAAVEDGHDHDRDPLRYQCTYTSHEIDLGTFSRKRSLSTRSTNVMG